MANWQFVLTDQYYNQVGEITNAYDRKVTIALSKLASASFRLRLDHPLAEPISDCNGYIKGYRNGVLRYIGPIISAEEVADPNNATIQVSSSDPGWVLSKRLVGKGTSGVLYRGGTWGRGAIINNLLNLLNIESETGVQAGTMRSDSIVDYAAGPYRPFMEIVGELSASTEGYDWIINPVENFAGGVVTGQKIGEMVLAPVIGSDANDAVLEYGTGRANMASYRIVTDRSTQANQVYHYTSNGPGSAAYPRVVASDAASIAKWRLLEDIAQADIFDATLRQRFVEEHVLVRKNPRRTIEIIPHIVPTVPDYGTDFNVGDRIRGRAVFNGALRFDAMLRVFAVAFAIDDTGQERMTLTVIEDQ